jgi:hypothetical protein
MVRRIKKTISAQLYQTELSVFLFISYNDTIMPIIIMCIKHHLGRVFLTLLVLSIAVFLASCPDARAATNQWSTITPSSTSGYAFNTIAAIGNYIYLGTDHGVYRSLDGGNTWSQINSGLSTHLNITAIVIGWVYNLGAGAYATTSSSFVFIGTSDGGVFSSTLGGVASTTWAATSTGLSGSGLDILDLKIDQSQATQGSFTDLYAATPNGVYISTTTGSYWQLDDSGLSGQPTKLVTDYGNAVIYVLTNGNKLYSSSLYSFGPPHNYESWSQVFDANGTTTNDVSIINAVGGIGWLATGKGIYKSDTYGANWASTSVGLTGSAVDNVASDYLDSNLAYASIPGSGVYRTTDDAIANANPQIPEWLPINIGLSDVNIKEVKTDPSTSKVVYAVGASGLYKLVYASTPIENIDLTPPSDVTNLSVATTSTPSTVVLAWTAPGSNSVYGTSTTYDLRYSTSTITNGNFSSSTQVSPEPTPHVSGYAESYNATSLPVGNELFFGLIAYDQAGNVSNLSNVASANLTAPSVSVVSPTNVGATSATFNGSITSLGFSNATVEGFEWGTGTTYGTIDSNTGSFATSSYTDNASSLACNTTYHYRFFATNSIGTASSTDQSFVTSACPVSTPPGGGGGGGGGYVPPITIQPSNCPTGLICTPTATTTIATTTCSTSSSALPSYVSTLTIGSRGTNVTNLQTFLAIQGFTKQQYITGYFGAVTEAALKAYIADHSFSCTPTAQIANSIACPQGLICTPITTAPTSNGMTVPVSVSFARSLYLGSTGPDVLLLQKILNSLGYVVSSSGNGSPSHETTYFGTATAAALGRFQCAEQIVCVGDPGYGLLGPKTIATFLGKATQASTSLQ